MSTFAKEQIKKAQVKEEVDSDYERERKEELDKKIDKWKMTKEYERLGAKARTIVEERMRKEEEKCS